MPKKEHPRIEARVCVYLCSKLTGRSIETLRKLFYRKKLKWNQEDTTKFLQDYIHKGIFIKKNFEENNFEEND